MAKELKDAIGGLESGPQTTPGADAAPRGAAALQSYPSVEALRAQFGAGVLHHTIAGGDEHVVYVDPARLQEILRWCKAEEKYDLLKDLTAVDYGAGRPLEVIYELWSVTRRIGMRLKVTLPLDALEVDSAEPVWKTANWLEREVYDLFGVNFRGHPDLRRIMMPENYAEGHPLRKDFPLRGRFTRAEQTRRALAGSPEDSYTPQELQVIDGEPELPPRPNTADDFSLGSSGSAAAGQQNVQGGGQ